MLVVQYKLSTKRKESEVEFQRPWLVVDKTTNMNNEINMNEFSYHCEALIGNGNMTKVHFEEIKMYLKTNNLEQSSVELLKNIEKVYIKNGWNAPVT